MKTCACCGFSSETTQLFRHPLPGEGPYRFDDDRYAAWICRSEAKCRERSGT